MRVAIVDPGMGNLFSVRQAVEMSGADGVITSAPEEIVAADAVVLPGVGAMPDAMANLQSTGADQAIKESVAAGKSLMGICLGMQLLMTHGTEFGEHRGLGLIEGSVVRFPEPPQRGTAFRVPHIGWSAINPARDWQNTPLRVLNPGAFMYFVHSYVAQPADDSVVLAAADYEHVRFCAALQKDNVFGCQFHPERSATEGLAILQSFIQQANKS